MYNCTLCGTMTANKPDSDGDAICDICTEHIADTYPLELDTVERIVKNICDSEGQYQWEYKAIKTLKVCKRCNYIIKPYRTPLKVSINSFFFTGSIYFCIQCTSQSDLDFL